MGLPRALHCQAGRPHSDKQIHGGETGEKEKQNGLCTVERGRKGESNEDIEGYADIGGLLAFWGHGEGHEE